MSYTTCSSCKADLHQIEPTMAEDIGDYAACPYCNATLERCFTDAEWLLKLAERVDELLEKNRALEDGMMRQGQVLVIQSDNAQTMRNKINELVDKSIETQTRLALVVNDVEKLEQLGIGEE